LEVPFTAPSDPSASGVNQQDCPAVYIKALKDEDFAILRKYAQLKMSGLRHKVLHADHEDLLNEAIERTLDGRRNLNRKVDTVTNLIGSMRSIAHEWTENAARHTVLSDDLHDGNSIKSSILNGIVRERIRKEFDHDAELRSLWHSMCDGDFPHETKAKLNMSSAIYDTVKKRLIREWLWRKSVGTRIRRWVEGGRGDEPDLQLTGCSYAEAMKKFDALRVRRKAITAGDNPSRITA
jgi:hypothetical protein